MAKDQTKYYTFLKEIPSNPTDKKRYSVLFQGEHYTVVYRSGKWWWGNKGNWDVLILQVELTELLWLYPTNPKFKPDVTLEQIAFRKQILKK